MARPSSRKRRKRSTAVSGGSSRGGGRSGGSDTESSAAGRPATTQEFMERGYARGRVKDAEARARLKPLAPGERPGAVTVGAVVAAVAAVANVVSLVLAYDPDEPGKSFTTAFGSVLLVLVAVGMWRARYWAVLGLQALLALTMIGGALALLLASDLWAGTLAFLIVAASGTLFWFLVKAMARIQMPQRPRADR